MSGSGRIRVISLWGLKETEMKEDVVITCLDTESDKAEAHFLLSGILLKCPAGQEG